MQLWPWFEEPRNTFRSPKARERKGADQKYSLEISKNAI